MTGSRENPKGNRIAILAGNGVLPLEVARGLTAKGEDVYIVGILGEVDAEIGKFQHDFMEWGQIGLLFRLLQQNQVDRIVLAGGIVGRPEIKLSKMDLGAFRTVPGLISALMGGDNTILSGVINVFEKRGFKVCGLAEILPELLVRLGPNTSTKPGIRDLQRLQRGARLAQSLGRFDVGQACVMIGRRAVAVEGVEGTDGMLERIVHLRKIGRLPDKKGGVLVKCLKSGQDERADLPTMGPQTIEKVHAAQLNGIGLEAGKSIIVEREKTLSMARKLGIFVYGIDLNAEDMSFQS